MLLVVPSTVLWLLVFLNDLPRGTIHTMARSGSSNDKPNQPHASSKKKKAAGKNKNNAKKRHWQNRKQHREPSSGTATSMQPAVDLDPEWNRAKSQPAEPDHQSELWWQEHDKCVPLASEEIMIRVLVKYGKRERGMIKDHPPKRLTQIQERLRNAPGLRLDQALSLRRHHMNLLNPYHSKVSLGMGTDQDVQESARIFERTVETFLKQNKIALFNDEEQRSKFPMNRLTPDFIFPRPICLKKWRNSKGRKVIEERTIHWVEAKMFYGASTIPAGTRGAVGTILAKMEKYVTLFGKGAIVFMHGCGDQLANKLASMGVTVLCGAGIPKELMQDVWEHQRTWCAKGDDILP